MNFASIEFFVFFAVVYGLYQVLSHRWQNWLLLAASYYFYAAWDWRFLSLIGLSTLIDFYIGRSLHRTEHCKEKTHRRKALLLLSLGLNLGFLGCFKYLGFFAESFTHLLTTLGMSADWPTINILLPVGISFYTFQTLSYTIDIYRKKLEPVENLRDFAVFVAFFPQLVAGPIERASHFLPQVMAKRRVTLGGTTRGIFLILFGLFKKVAIADGLSTTVDAIYGTTGTVSTLDIILATYLFAIQIYCDFSGYTDIARGVSKLLGFDLMENFNAPYFAVNPSDFWRRWHISLSTWLRDYLYIPLGGNRNGNRQTYRNLMLTMILGGIWHGAAWNFALWGAYQGGILCLHRLVAGAKPTIRPVKSLWDRVRRGFIILGFFQVVCYGWLLFRANSFGQLVTFTDQLFFHPVWIAPVISQPPLAAIAGIAVLFIVDFARYLSGTAVFYRRWPIFIRTALYAGLAVITLMGLSSTGSTFIYFQF
ncbi:MAG: MBOAT family O-acyltransferase [Cyanobacteria bacterium J06621_11]